METRNSWRCVLDRDIPLPRIFRLISSANNSQGFLTCHLPPRMIRFVDTGFPLALLFFPITGKCASGMSYPDLFLSTIIDYRMNLRSSETYGQIYNPQRFEPRRWIERLGGVGDLTEGHPAFGFGRRLEHRILCLVSLEC